MPQQQPDKDACIEAARTIPNLFYINKWTIPAPIKLYGGQDALADIKAYNKKIDILYIDAWHTEEYVKQEWKLYSPMLADNALVICDDLGDGSYGPFEGMEDWWVDFKYPKFINTDIHWGIQMGFMKFTRKTKKV